MAFLSKNRDKKTSEPEQNQAEECPAHKRPADCARFIRSHFGAKAFDVFDMKRTRQPLLVGTGEDKVEAHQCQDDAEENKCLPAGYEREGENNARKRDLAVHSE